jgi:hypothetical protein
MNEEELLNEMINQYDMYLKNRANFDINDSILAETELSILNGNTSLPFLGEIKIWELVAFFSFFLVILSNLIQFKLEKYNKKTINLLFLIQVSIVFTLNKLFKNLNSCECCEDKQSIVKSVLIDDVRKKNMNDQFVLKNQNDLSDYKLQSQDLFHI